MSRLSGKLWLTALALVCLGGTARAADHVTLRNGFDLICDHRAAAGDADGQKVRLYMDAAGANFVEVTASDIVSEEQVTLPSPPPAATARPTGSVSVPAEKLSEADLRPILTKAGAVYDLDSDLLASVVRQESGGHAHAISRAGAQGLMQLMPGTASEMGVTNTFAPGENIQGGTAYLDMLLRKYHDNLPLALAAYNAGPAAVDRWHGIPPYAETRAYVARVIHEYNRRYALRRKADSHSGQQVATLTPTLTH
jgi:soluble lytic murein transglycosylase-like protein